MQNYTVKVKVNNKYVMVDIKANSQAEANAKAAQRYR